MFLRGLEDLPGVIIGKCNINNIHYTVDVLMAEREQKLKILLNKFVDKQERKD